MLKTTRLVILGVVGLFELFGFLVCDEDATDEGEWSCCSVSLHDSDCEWGVAEAKEGVIHIWSDHGAKRIDSVLRAHRSLIFGKRASEPGLSEMTRERALQVLDNEGGELPKSVMLRCRVRYFTDGAILGSAEFVRGFASTWQGERGRKHPPKVNVMRGTKWGNLAVVQGLRRQVFG